MGKQLKDGRALMTVSAKTAAILNGDEDLSAWDDEELLRGQRKDRSGSFRGRPPKVVPQEVHAERVRRTMSKAFDLLKESTYDAVRLLQSVVNDESASTAHRLQAAQLILDRVLPKSQSVQLSLGASADPPWLNAIRNGLTLIPGRDEDDGVIEAEVVTEAVDGNP